MEDLDLTEFHDVFFDEAAEHLAAMETLLVGIDVTAADAEDLNAIFRAAHSIKGGAAVFGFKDMTELTHEMETVFDLVRKGQMPLSHDLVNAFLASGDTLTAMVAARRGDGPGAAADDVAALCTRLRSFRNPAAAASAPVATPAATKTVTDTAPGAFEVALGPFDDAFASSAVEGVLEALKPFGTVEEVTMPALKSKRGKAKAPSERRILRIVTAASATAIGDAIASLVPAGHVSILLADDAAPLEALAAAAALASSTAPASPSALAAPPSATPAVASATAAPPIKEDDDFGFFLDPATLPASAPPTAPVAKAAEAPSQEGPSTARPQGTQGTVDASSIRVSVQKVDELINLVGELVITQSMLAQTASESDPALYQKLFNGLAQLQRNTRDLQESAMAIRMLPMSFVFGRFPRVVRDLASQLNKQVELKTEGESTELDKGLIERIVDPLTHLVRNSLDHGIESPAAREAAGKPAKGTITLRAFHRGGHIMIEVIDDGAGLDRKRLLVKARERGMSVSDTMSDQEVFQLIFEAGFSTAEKVTDVSGRGVGMDVVRRNIRGMGGSVEIDSMLGTGTRITIRLPLTLAILEGMSVAVGEEVFIIPLTHITESLQPLKEHLKSVAGRGHVVQVRGDYLPIVSLHQVFNLRPNVKEFHEGIMVVLESEGAKTALFVDELLGQHQVVIKSLETNYRRVHGVSGATIMGDGRVALILDVAGLVGASRFAHARAHA